MMKVWRIYKITAKDGRGYIGITTRSLADRWRQHLTDARNNTGYAIHNAIKKHGADFFAVEELAVCESAKEAGVCERAQIAQHGTFVRTGNGFNLTLGGDGNWGWTPTAAALEKMRAKGRQRALDPEWKAKLDEGKRHSTKVGKHERTAETRAKLSAANSGKKLSPEHIEKLRTASAGRVKSEETKKRLRDNWAARKAAGWRPSATTVEKMRATKTGQKQSEEHAIASRARLAEIRARPMKEETRAKLSSGRKAWLKTEAGLAWIAATVERNRNSGKATAERNKVLWRTNPKYRAGRMRCMPQYRHLTDDERLVLATVQVASGNGLATALARATSSENKLFAEQRFVAPLVEA